MLKVGIIGYGYMGEIRRRVIENHSGLTLDIVCETNLEKLNGQYPFKVVRDPEAVVRSDVDAIFVCTPNNLTPPLAIESLRTGKHVFCEKPPGRNLQEILDIQVQEKKSPNQKLMFGFNTRYHPGILRAKSLIATGKFGDVLWLRGLYGKSGGKSFPTSWRNSKEVSGGGILLDQGIHMLDLFCYFCGDFPDVKAFTGNKYWNTEVEDNAFVILQNKKGQHASLHSSATFWKHKFQLEIGLEKGYLTVQGLLTKTGSYGRETLIVGRQQFEDEADAVGNPSEEITYFDRDLSWEAEVDYFVDCIVNNKVVEKSSSEDAVTVMRIIDKVYDQAPPSSHKG